jgi:S1-C subfamily serine protease
MIAIGLMAGALFGVAGTSASATPVAIAAPSSQAAAAQSKGVVLIDTVLRYAGARGAGTGVLLTSSGQIMTNYHVIEGTTSITVTVASTGTTYAATVVGHDQTRDVALLQLEAASGLDTVAVDHDPVAVGDRVTAVGNAGGTGSLTAADGRVTALDATVTTAAEGAVAAETLTSMIETDADVVAGDSGGPLFDAQGEVTGINTAGSNGPPIDSFAIPIREALSVVDQINTGTETDTVQVGASPLLGVLLGDASDASNGLQEGMPGDSDGPWGTDTGTSRAGAMVQDVVPDGPADEAGLAAGDLITAVDSQSITTVDELSDLLEAHDVGDRIAVHWSDGSGTGHSATITLAANPIA